MTQAWTRFDVSDTPGPYCPGLLPLTTLLAPFAEVISYRSYRLRNTRGDVTLAESGSITRIKRRFDDFYPRFAPFDGSTPIRLLEFLTTLRDVFNALEASEAVAASLLTYYLERSTKTLYASQRSSGVRSEAGALAGTWSYLIHELIKGYLTDDVLQTAYEQVTDARQKANEDENAFADRVAKAARDCCNVFRGREMVNYFIRGLLPATRDVVTERVRHLTPNEQGDYSNVPQSPRSPGRPGRGRGRGTLPSGRGGSSANRPYPNRRERDSQKQKVSFGRSNGVYITTHVSSDPTHPAWADSVSDPDDEDPTPLPKNGPGQ